MGTLTQYGPLSYHAVPRLSMNILDFFEAGASFFYTFYNKHSVLLSPSDKFLCIQQKMRPPAGGRILNLQDYSSEKPKLLTSASSFFPFLQ